MSGTQSLSIVHIARSDTGGAARAALRLHTGLLEKGISSSFVVLDKKTNVPYVSQARPPFEEYGKKKVWQTLKDELQARERTQTLKGKTKGFDIFSFPNSIYRLQKSTHIQAADIIHLHWVGNYIDYPTFFHAIQKPIVWTLHDMNPFTAGCHYAGICTQYQTACNECPQLEGTTNPSIVTHYFKIKKKAIHQSKRLTLVCPSHWLQTCAQRSAIFQQNTVLHIPYGLETDTFYPFDRQIARQVLQLPPDAPIVLFVADRLDNIRKGMQILLNILPNADLPTDTILLTVGNANIKIDTNSLRVHHLGNIQDDRLLNLAYAACNLFVIPSLEDNLPNTVLEAMACGRAVIGLAVGGIVDMVDDKVTGRLIPTNQIEELAHTLQELLHSPTQTDMMGQAARKKVLHYYTQEAQAQAYLNLYQRLLS